MFQSWPRPPVTALRHRGECATGSGASWTRTRVVAAAPTRKVAASTAATAPPPLAAKSPAPASGETNRPISWSATDRPLTRARAAGENIRVKSADSAGPESVRAVPYQSTTA